MSTQTAAPHPEPSTPVSDGRCQRLRTDGKRCAAPAYPGHASLCHFHLSREMRGISDGELLAADILNSIGNFQSATAINLALGKIFLHQITGRLSRQDALALCYNCQLLLHSLPLVKRELVDGGFDHYWREDTARILSSNPDLCHQTKQRPSSHGPRTAQTRSPRRARLIHQTQRSLHSGKFGRSMMCADIAAISCKEDSDYGEAA